jgi:hypothetical protein
MPRPAAQLVLAILLSASALPLLQCIDGAPPASPRAEPAPPWAIGSRWTWSADQDLSFCITLSGATIRINHVSGDMKDTLTNLTSFNGTDVYQVEALYSETLTGTLTVFGFPTPISWPVTGNGTFLYRIPDLALVCQYQHVTIDMGALIGQFTADTSTVASPPVGSYRFPLDILDSWHIGSDLSVWTRTSGAGGAFETTSNDRLDADATVPRMQDATVPAGTFSCYNITYNGTHTSGGGAPTPQNSSVLYSPKATNLLYRNFSPMAGLDVLFSLSGYSLNHAPAVASPVPEVVFPEDRVGTLYLNTVFSDTDAGDRLSYTMSNFSNITPTADGSVGVATFVAPADWSGAERIVFTAKDSKGAAATTVVNVTVMPVNDQPELLAPLPAVIMDEDTVNDTLNLSAHFDDADFPYGDSLSFSFKQNGSIGVRISPSGIVTLRPFDDWSGVLNITIIATDTAGDRASGVLKVAVLNTPDAPVVVASSHIFTILEDETLSVDVSERFRDADVPYGDTLEYSIADLPEGWDARLDGRTGALELSPPRDFYGIMKFTFTARDRGGLNANEQSELRVIGQNDPPVILGAFPAVGSKTMSENSSADFSVVAADVDSTALRYAWYLDGEEMGSGANFTYFADFDSAGKRNLTATVSDGALNASRTWTLTVANVNRPPENVSILSPATGAKYPLGGKVDLAGAATDPDNDLLTFSWKDTNGKLLGTGRSVETKTLSKGKHVVTLEVSDGNATVSSSVTLSVVPPPEQRTPGLGPAGVILGAALAMLLGALAKRRRRGGSDAASPAK